MHPRQQRRAFNTLFLTEMWERFGFYTVSSILILYMTKALGFNDTQAYTAYATFSALLYITPMVGGYLADHFIGVKRSLILGTITLTLGYVFVSIPGRHYLYYGLSLVIIGGGFFKFSPYALLGKVYEKQPHLFDSRFTIYYLSINIGGIPALIFAGTIAHHYGWNTAFSFAAVGMLIGTVTFILLRKVFLGVGNDIDEKPAKLFHLSAIFVGILLVAFACSYLLTHARVADYLIYTLSALILVYICYLMKSMPSQARNRLIACILLFAYGIGFFVFYYQAPTSLTLFIDRTVNHHVLGFYIPSSSFWAFNPVFIILFAPLISMIYRRLGKRDPSIASKFGVGILFMGFSYFIIWMACSHANSQGVVSPWWVISSYAFQAIGELMVNALGSGLAAKYAPKQLVGLVTGIWFCATAIGGIFAGKLANITAISPHQTNHFAILHVYSRAFTVFGWIAIAIGISALMLAPLIKRLTSEDGKSKNFKQNNALATDNR